MSTLTSSTPSSVAFTSPHDSTFHKDDLFTPTIIAFIKDFNERPQNVNADIMIKKDNLVMNPQFRCLFWEAYKDFATQDPDVREFAKTVRNAYIPLIDYRSPLENDAVEEENVIGVVQVKNGKVVEDTFIGNKDHSFYDDRFGWTAISQFMFKKVVQKLQQSANALNQNKK